MLFRLRHHRASRVTAVIALLAIILQTVLPVFHHPVAATSHMMMPMCAMVMPGGMADHGGSKTAPEKLPPCPICQTLNLLSAGYVPPADIILVLRPGHIPLGQMPDDARHDHLAYRVVAQPRAPPSLV